ncbi:MAG: hypothetical protein MO852_02850 [Candidatus Devosia euplotis]|nr:hypothetical protein [Candidatus Devosia euplotis]
MRLIHYLPMENAKPHDFKGWRAGAHTDFDCLTLLRQRVGQGGLQLCPGRESDGELAWTDVEPKSGVVTCNIGDMLMRWSDDKLLSTLHRVRMPAPHEYLGPRYSLPFFCQANKDAIIQGPEGKYEPLPPTTTCSSASPPTGYDERGGAVRRTLHPASVVSANWCAPHSHPTDRFWDTAELALMTEIGRFADGDCMATGEASLDQISVASDSDKASSTSTPR